MTPEKSAAKSILVVEDDATIREAMSFLLGLEGYAVAEAANGREALCYLRRTEPPALILLDLMMPVMDGWQFREEQQQDPKLAEIPVLVVSAAGAIREKAAALGVAGYLEKPIEMDDLLTAVQRHC